MKPTLVLPLIAFCLLALPAMGKAEELGENLTPEKVIALCLENSLGVKMARVSQESAHEDITASQSIYDTTLRLHTSYLRDQYQKVIPVFGTKNTTLQFGGDLLTHTLLGNDLALSFKNQRDSTDSPFATLNPAYDSRAEISLRQPLLKNAFGILDRKRIDEVKKRVEAFDFQTRAQIEALVYESLLAYWNLWFAEQNENLEAQSVRQALNLQKANESKNKMGMVESVELNAFKANAELRQASLQLAHANRVLAQEQLKNLLSLEKVSIQKGVKPQPLESTQLKNALDRALAHRLDYLAIKKNIEASHIQLAHRKNARWPQLDLLATFGLNGVDSRYAQALGNIDDPNPAWSVGMDLQIPLQNRFQRSEYKKSRLALVEDVLRLKSKENEIVTQVHQKLAEIQYHQARLSSLVLAEKSQGTKTAEQNQRYQQGRSDSDVTIRYENDYLDAQKLRLMAQTDLAKVYMDTRYVLGEMIQP